MDPVYGTPSPQPRSTRLLLLYDIEGEGPVVLSSRCSRDVVGHGVALAYRPAGEPYGCRTRGGEGGQRGGERAPGGGDRPRRGGNRVTGKPSGPVATVVEDGVRVFRKRFQGH